MGDRQSCEECLVGGRLRKPAVRQPDAGPVLHYPQLEKGMVCHFSADHYRQLERPERQRLDRALRRRSWKSAKAWESARQLEGGIFRQRRASKRRFVLDHARDSGFPVPQVLEGIEESDDASNTVKKLAQRIKQCSMNATKC